MFLLAVAAYFFLACLVSWLILFPAGREFFLQTLAGFGLRAHKRVGQIARRQGEGVVKIHQSGRNSLRGLIAFVQQHYLLFIAGVALILVPPTVAFISGFDVSLGDYEPSTHQANDQVVVLMEGEQLVPPPALPPAVFATVEVEQERPMLVTADRKWEAMDPVFTQTMLKIFKVMKEKHGYDMALLEGYRSPERQEKLAAMGGHVTNARAYQSYHQHGLAVDSAFLRNGKIVITEKDPWAMRGYQLYGEVAESFGLVWGGRWKMMDFGHVEERRKGVMDKYRNK